MTGIWISHIVFAFIRQCPFSYWEVIHVADRIVLLAEAVRGVT
jgi:hypothetical protein